MHWQKQSMVFTISLLLFGSILCLKQSYDMIIEKIQFNLLPGQKYIDGSNLHLMGRNRVINGTIETFEDADDDHFEISIALYSDSQGNGNFRPLPYNISNIGPCAAFREYGDYAKPSLQEGVNTNIPIDGNTCPFPKGIYYFNDIEVSTDNLPSQVPRGFIKGILSFYKDGEYFGEFELLCRVEEKYMHH